MKPTQYVLNDPCCCCCFRFDQNNSSITTLCQAVKTDVIQTSDSCCSCCSCISFVNDSCTQSKQNNSDQEKTSNKKIHALNELIQTERDYVFDLNNFVQVYLQVLGRQHWILSEHKKIITRNIHDILAFHKSFITSFNSIQHDPSLIAKTFLNQVSQFTLYKPYCDGHAQAWSLVLIYRDRSEWTQFTRECLEDVRIKNVQQRKLQFQDYLIKPIQRICRYQLLIKEIVRYSSPQTPEHDLWTAVLGEMQDIVTEIDELKFQRDMKECTDRFIERLDGGDWRMTRHHVSQLGHLLVAGAIEITYSALGQSVSKPRYLGCFIFPAYIIMIRPKKVTNYEPKHWFPLRQADFENLEDIEGQREHSFIVRCKKHTFIFSATCVQEKQLWVNKIQEAITRAKQRPVDDPIISSLSGVTLKKPTHLRLSRSFTHILDMGDKMDRSLVRRSISTRDGLEEPLTGLVKRYSADYATRKKTSLKPRNNSESYGMPRRRPSSLDLLAENMFGKMSSQLKNNHQNTLRLNVDHKLRDVCTQEYLASRAWYMRDTYSPTESPDAIKKKKSTLLRHSVSNFSIRARDPRQEFDAQSACSDNSSLIRVSHESSVQSNQETIDCIFHVAPSLADSNCSAVKKNKKKALAERVLKRITSIRQIKQPLPEWNVSGDTLKCEISEEAKKLFQKKRRPFVDQKNEESSITAFAYASTPASKRKLNWKIFC